MISQVKVVVFATVVALFMLSVYSPARQNYLDTAITPSSRTVFRYLDPVHITESTLSDFYDTHEENAEYTLDTEGCKIPNMRPLLSAFYSFKIKNKKTCGPRNVHLVKINNTHARLVTDKKFAMKIKNCFYQFIYRSKVAGKEDTDIVLSPKKFFVGDTIIRPESDFTQVKCALMKFRQKEDVYADLYTAIKKVEEIPKQAEDQTKSWNILIIGLDTMSRIRTAETLKRTFAYLHKDQWIDFKGYQKIGDNTFPNLIAALTGKIRATMDKECNSSMNLCNHLFIWSKFKKMGYTTAYGEDTTVPDTFSHPGYKASPTDHYMRPFFKMEQSVKSIGNENKIFCNGKKPTGEHVLDYARDFAQTYKTERFFGFFWVNAFHDGTNSHPEYLDEGLTNLFSNLKSNQILNNTFVVFMSDHGVRFGAVRRSMATYYEERLPTLIMWVPYTFRKVFKDEYNTLVGNRLRLVTPYDLYMTFEDILQKSSGSADIYSSEGCPKCKSMFKPISSNRTCLDAGVDQKWCACHNLEEVSKNDNQGIAAVDFILKIIRNISANIETTHCTKCANFKLSSITRIHAYYNVKKFYVVAFIVSPGNVGYEATVSYDGHMYEKVGIVSTISPHFGNGACVKNKILYLYCYCEKIKTCR